MLKGARTGRLILVAAIVAGVGAPAAAQSPPPTQNQEILDELKAIRQLLERIAGPPGQPGALSAGTAAARSDKVRLADVTGYMLGQLDAPVTMVEFTDLQCPFCRQFYVTTFERLKTEYIDTGKLRYFSRDFPLDQLHPLAISAARAARCAAEQGTFWEMRHAILLNNANLTPALFTTLAQDLKLKVPAFQTCVEDTARVDAEWQKDRTDGASVGISGTPSFVIGRTMATGLEGVRLVGAQSYAAFEIKIKELLVTDSAHE